MNLELIKKYEKEFLHMLHGGSILIYNNHKGWIEYNDENIWIQQSYGKIIINDKYVKFRKALADGKIVEANYNKWVFPEISIKRWGTVTAEAFDRYGIDDLRIKPEEPKFKVGDYVRYIYTNSPKPLRIININCERYYFENAEIILRLDEIEKWEPKAGEICIFWDCINNDARISKFSHMKQEKYSTAFHTWNYCMPFTGTLPPHMKDSK